MPLTAYAPVGDPDNNHRRHRESRLFSQSILTILTPNNTNLICRVQLKGEGRWVSLSLSLGEFSPAPRFLAISEPFLYEIAGLDETAQTYNLANWQGGVISGARYAFRTLRAPLQQVRLHELRGQLSSGDIGAISSAAAAAVAQLLARQLDFAQDLAGWKIETELSPLGSLREAGAIPQDTSATFTAPSHPAPPA
ncbi:MAG: hypothetical protein HY000_30370 [Planctomycetes bacterium]|nr:hypothetical protein [Planctomycetota bacterium]